MILRVETAPHFLSITVWWPICVVCTRIVTVSHSLYNSASTPNTTIASVHFVEATCNCFLRSVQETHLVSWTIQAAVFDSLSTNCCRASLCTTHSVW